MSTPGFQHRSTGSKQENKPFKSGKHRSKGQIKQAASGKVNKTRTEAFKNTAKTVADSKKTRKLRAKQIAQNKRQALIRSNRVGLGDSPPRIVAIIGLTSSVKPVELEKAVIQSVLLSDPNCAPVNPEEGKKIGGVTIQISRFKTRVTLYSVSTSNTTSILDIGKVADVLVFVSHAQDVLQNEAVANPFGLKIISLMKEQSLPEVIGAVQGLELLPAKLRAPCKKACGEFFQRQIHEKTRVLPVDTEADMGQFVRFLCTEPIQPLPWRSNRPYMLVDNVHWQPDDVISSTQPQFGTLQLSGYLRGAKLNVNNILHITGYGDVQIAKITGGHDPYAPTRAREGKDMSLEGVQTVRYDLAVSDPAIQETLERENAPDPFAGEQTWPTPEELQQAEMERRTVIKRVPVGTNPYQAAWIPEGDSEDEDNDDEDDEEGDSDQSMELDAKSPSTTPQPASAGQLPFPQKKLTQKEAHQEGEGEACLDEEIDQTEATDLNTEELEHLKFPDEIDTPEDIPARIRFQKYRGLKSFRTSPWDPKENLPFDYAKIFQFQNFKRTLRRVLNEHDGIMADGYITVYIKNIAAQQFESHPADCPLIVSGLFKYENKVSVVNFAVHRVAQYVEPVKNHSACLVQAGFRRFQGKPLYSEYNLNGDKFKQLKFFRGSAIASFYAPICFPPTPILLFCTRRHRFSVLLTMIAESGSDLIACGNLHSVNPDHIILKKIVLSGLPVRARKGKATVKQMFFNPDDVRWFRPIELWTKYGRVGRIIEPVGTHGEMKCSFDGVLTQQDTIMMSLYKRVFPKWVVFPELLKPTDDSNKQ